MVKIGKTSVELVKGDITELDTDAIVNAANSRLRHGAGVAGAIAQKGGHAIQRESDKIGFCAVGSAVITTGGKLKARYVIHAVGPVNGEGNEDEKLRHATLSALRLADRHKLRSLAFPAISAGSFGFPKDRCAKIMTSTVQEYARQETGLQRVVFCLYDDETFRIFKEEVDKL